MKQEPIEILGKKFTFELLPLKQRTRLKFKLAALGLKDLKADKETFAVIGTIIEEMGPEGSTSFLIDMAKTSIVDPPQFSKDRKEDEFLEAVEALEDETGKDGISILWMLAIESLLYQFGGIVETLGKKSGISVQKIRESLRERLS